MLPLKLRKIILAGGFCLFFGMPVLGAWEIDSFETNIAIHKNASATVVETIRADFGAEQRHGIYRSIPVHYVDTQGQHFKMRIRVVNVMDQNFRALRHTLQQEGRYVRIRIGDPSVTMTGLQTYQITYEVERGAVRFFPDHDECYWNLTGNEWAVRIRRAHAEIRLPEGAKSVRAAGYMGYYGSTEKVQSIENYGGGIVLNPGRTLEPYEGLTGVVGWSKGAVEEPDFLKNLRWWLQDNWVYGIPFLVFAFMLWFWKKIGRDPQLSRSEAVEYEPPDHLTPAELGTLMDENVDIRDITATILDLAVRGYLKIEPEKSQLLGLTVKTDYLLTSVKDWKADSLKPHEAAVLEEIFKVPKTSTRTSDLEQVFYEKLPSIRTQIYETLKQGGYFHSNPESVRTAFVGAGIAGGVLFGVPLFSFSVNSLSISPFSAVFVSVLSSLIVIIGGHFMPRKTIKGAETKSRLMGFFEFLRRTDQDKIRRMNNPSLFEKCLPYALALGVAEQWSRAFEGLYVQPPSWYVGDSHGFSASRFGRDMNHTMSSIGQSLQAAPRSSSSYGGSGFGGGGSSGGGGGGGGGGAW